MSCYHISYACSGGADFNYVRARRYPARGNFDKDTRLLPSYENLDLFKPGETWHFVVEKMGRQVRMLCRYGGLNQRAAAVEIGVQTGAAVCMRQRRLREALKHDRALARRVARIEGRLDILLRQDRRK